jgi:hypothetical protein
MKSRSWSRSAVVLTAAAVLGLMVSAAANAAVVVNQRFTVVETDSLCTPEPVVMTATVHLVITETITPSGAVQITFHGEEQGQAVAPSGVKYVANNTEEFHFTGRLGTAQTFTETSHLNFIRQGESVPADDFYGHMIFHVTLNAQGQVTADVAHVNESCK